MSRSNYTPRCAPLHCLGCCQPKRRQVLLGGITGRGPKTESVAPCVVSCHGCWLGGTIDKLQKGRFWSICMCEPPSLWFWVSEWDGTLKLWSLGSGERRIKDLRVLEWEKMCGCRFGCVLLRDNVGLNMWGGERERDRKREREREITSDTEISTSESGLLNRSLIRVFLCCCCPCLSCHKILIPMVIRKNIHCTPWDS